MARLGFSVSIAFKAPKLSLASPHTIRSCCWLMSCVSPSITIG